MIELMNKISTSVDLLDRVIRNVKARHVNKRKPKDLVRQLAREYFGQWRSTLVKHLGGEDDLLGIDAIVQELVRMAQTRTQVSEYRRAIVAMKYNINGLEVKLLCFSPPLSVSSTVSSQHQRILDSLRKLSPSAADSFEQGLLDIKGASRKSWRGTCVEFRESLRETLDALAPDDAVSAQPNFKLEPDTKGPTMKQKAVFILRARQKKEPQVKTFCDAIEVVEERIGRFVRSVYTRSSVATHVAQTADEAHMIRDYVTLVLGELLEIKG
jgi:hypothetical protein